MGGSDMRGVINIIFGAIFIIGGLSGKLVFRGTHSGAAIAGVGVFLVLLGIVRLAASRNS
jgi:hypothetical protein